MRRSGRRNRATEEWVARKQMGPVLHKSGDEGLAEMLALIDAKGGDYYKPALNPAGDEAFKAWDNLPYSSTHTALQDELIEEAKRYYGLAGAGQAAPQQTVATLAPAPVQGPVTPPAKAQALKEEVVKQVKEKNPEAVVDKEAELLIDEYQTTAPRHQMIMNDLNSHLSNDDWLLMGLAGIGAAGLGAAARPVKSEEEIIQEYLASL